MEPHPTFRSLEDKLPAIEYEERPARSDRSMSVGVPSKPVLGLPLARWIPQDCHSLMDYSSGLAMASCAMLTDDKTARIASIALASSVVGVSVISDYRLSVAKLVPIEAHEVIDHVWGLTAIAAPFVLGYWKTAPKVAIAHIAAGVGAIVGSLFTDYRAYSKRTTR